MARKKKSDEDESINQNQSNQNDSDDTFGLPDIEYKPLNRNEEQPATQQEKQTTEVTQPEAPRYEYQQKQMEQNPETTYVPDDEDESSPVWPKIFGILLVVALALGAVWFFMIFKPGQAEKAKLELARIEREKVEAARQDSIATAHRLRDAEDKRIADSLANVSKVGAIETLSARTGRYYVVAASAVDDDLLMDHAKKLSKQGVSSKIIPPFGKYKLFRLTIADGETFAAAQEIANTKKPDFGEAVWVLKY